MIRKGKRIERNVSRLRRGLWPRPRLNQKEKRKKEKKK
jgi:hypothetical protein